MKYPTFLKKWFFDVLAIITFLGLVVLFYLFLTTPMFYGYQIIQNQNLFGGVMSVISAIILFAAFTQNLVSNSRESSYVFYQEELKNIAILEDNSSRRRKTKETDNYHKIFYIHFKKDLTFGTACDYLVEVNNALTNFEVDKRLEDFKKLSLVGDYNAVLLNMNNIEKYFKTYIDHLAMIYNEVENIENLVKRKKLIKPHAEMLFAKQYSLVRNFFVIIEGPADKIGWVPEMKVPVSSYVLEKEFVKLKYTNLFRRDKLLKAYELLKFLKDYEMKTIRPI